MKPAAFRYSAPVSVSAATALLAELGAGGKVLAGGQSLVPAMNFRLARLSHLVDINRIAALDYVRVEQGRLVIGALARHARFERALAPGPIGRLLPVVAHNIAHLPIRRHGTFAGSLTHADSAAEWCTFAATLDAKIVAECAGGRRTIAAADFFKSLFPTALEPHELITEVHLPLLDDAWRAGDYAIVMAVVAVRLAGSRIAEARIGLGGVVDRPVRATEAEAALKGAAGDGVAATAEAAGCWTSTR